MSITESDEEDTPISVRGLSGTCVQDWNTNDNPQSTEVTQLHECNMIPSASSIFNIAIQNIF
jgi:short subunit fatty acids transporter